MTTTMTITDPDWTVGELANAYADDETMTPEQCRDAADTETAWVINHLHERLGDGWTFTDGTFTGPAHKDAYSIITTMWVASADYVVEHLDEILAESTVSTG